jgi:hypothetical protein
VALVPAGDADARSGVETMSEFREVPGKAVYYVPSGTLRCPCCSNHANGQATAIGKEDPRPPQPGDHTVCAYCSAVLVFTPLMQLRMATPEEAAETLKDLRERRADA